MGPFVTVPLIVGAHLQIAGGDYYASCDSNPLSISAAGYCGAVAETSQRAQLRGFLMPLYPLPVILALGGFVFILFSRPNFPKGDEDRGIDPDRGCGGLCGALLYCRGSFR